MADFLRTLSVATAKRLSRYQPIADHIRNQIDTGELREGDPVPSVAEIIASRKVSRRVAQKAHNQLRDLILSQPGGWTVVARCRTVAADALVAEALHIKKGDPVRLQVAGNTAVFSRLTD